MADSDNEKDSRELGKKQERGAMLMTVVTIVVIAVVGAPCFCYFGIGLFQGIHILRTGQGNNPARQSLHEQPNRRGGTYKRDPKYDPKHKKTSADMAEEIQESPNN